jgi:hypothetical protein
MATRNLVRFMPHGAGKATTVNGKYSSSPGTILDVYSDTTEPATLTANGWGRIGTVGPTAQRPDPSQNVLVAGMAYIDTSLTQVVIWDGLNWRNPFTGAIT